MSKITTETQTQLSLIEQGLNNIQDFRTFDLQKLEKISGDLQEFNEKINIFGRGNTQTTNKLMTLTMLNGDGSPYRLLRQCLTQIENRKDALSSSSFNLQKSKIKLQKMYNKLEKLKKQEQTKPNQKLDFKIQLLEIEIDKILSSKAKSTAYIEGALKDLASFQDAYKQIKQAHNIPDNWDEKDMEEAEIQFHVRRAFELLYRDTLVHGRVGMGTIEYLQQFGIHPQTASTYINKYIQDSEELKKDNKLPNIEHLDLFLDEMANMFKNEYKLVLKKVGIENMITDFSQFVIPEREQERLANQKNQDE
jgi:hypothetical protein